MDSNKWLSRMFIDEISKKLIEAYPNFSKKAYSNLLSAMSKVAFEMFSSYAEKIKSDKTFLERNYPRFEREMLVSFITTIPNLNLDYSAADKDRIDSFITNTLNSADINVSKSQEKYLVNGLNDAIKVYAGLMKTDDREAHSYFNERVYNLVTGLKALLRKENTEHLIKDLKVSIRNVLEEADLDLKNFQIESLQDQFIWLFTDYINVGKDERENLYNIGEERILLSISDQDGHPKTLVIKR